MIGSPRIGAVGALAALLSIASVAHASGGNDQARANAYDDGWEADWVRHSRDVFNAGTGKIDGFVLQIGDSITHANPYGQWPRRGDGHTTDDAALLAWSPADVWGAGDTDSSSTNGWYLAAADTSNQRGMTAASGIDTDQFLSGDGNGGGAMPLELDPAAARAIVADGSSYTGNLHVETVVAAFEAAQFAVLMLGTNDANADRPVGEFGTNLAAIVDVLESRQIVVVVSTIPPNFDPARQVLVDQYNTEIRALASARGLALIDFHEEILARQPGTAYNGTLLVTDDVHPSGSGAGFDSASDPYTPGGDATTHCSGEAADNVGYLLRSWLTVQKLKEVRAFVVDGVDPPGGGGSTGGDDGSGSGATDGPGATTGSGPTSATAGASSSQGSQGETESSTDGGCGCRTTTNSAAVLWLVALIAVRRRRV